MAKLQYNFPAVSYFHRSILYSLG